MEYSNEFLARVYGAHYMCDYLDTLSNKVRKLEGDIISEIHAFGKYKTYQLCLTPLSAISNEDAVDVANICGYRGKPLQFMGRELVTKYLVKDMKTGIPPKIWIRVCDYLRSRGYDCGYAEIPSLIDVGLAIDKATLNN